MKNPRIIQRPTDPGPDQIDQAIAACGVMIVATLALLVWFLVGA